MNCHHGHQLRAPQTSVCAASFILVLLASSVQSFFLVPSPSSHRTNTATTRCLASTLHPVTSTPRHLNLQVNKESKTRMPKPTATPSCSSSSSSGGGGGGTKDGPLSPFIVKHMSDEDLERGPSLLMAETIRRRIVAGVPEHLRSRYPAAQIQVEDVSFSPIGASMSVRLPGIEDCPLTVRDEACRSSTLTLSREIAIECEGAEFSCTVEGGLERSGGVYWGDQDQLHAIIKMVDPDRGSGRVVTWLLKALNGGLEDGHDRLQRWMLTRGLLRLGEVDADGNRREWVEWEEQEYGYGWTDGEDGLDGNNECYAEQGEEYLW